MKKNFYSLAILAFVVALASCSKDDDHNLENTEQNL